MTARLHPGEPRPHPAFSIGAGAHGTRTYDWAGVPIRIGLRAGRGHWRQARRSISDGEIAYYVCHGPRRSTLADLARIAGSRWRIEECFQQPKNEAGLDHCQVRSFRAWYAHITLSMLALARLAVTKSLATKGNQPSPPKQVSLIGCFWEVAMIMREKSTV